MATAIDPICKMNVDTDNPSGGQSEYQGTKYYFCAPGCRVAFDQDPEKYLAGDWQGISMESDRESDRESEPEPKRGSFLSRLFGR